MKTKKGTTVFSIRAACDDLETWKAYAQVSGITITTMVTTAMMEYMDSHPLTGFKANIFNTLIGGKHMTVREWVEEEVSKGIYAEEEQHGRHFPEDIKQTCINDLVNDIVDGWQGSDDPLDDDQDTRYWKDRTIDYIEEQVEKIVEYLASLEDESN